MIQSSSELPAPNPPSITLGSGREVSKASLFKVLQVGGWAATYVVCAAAGGRDGLWATLFNTLVWAGLGFVITLCIHRVYRRSRQRHHSYIFFAAIALTLSVLLAPLWNLMEVIGLRVTLNAM